jgi:hypothetical protein
MGGTVSKKTPEEIREERRRERWRAILTPWITMGSVVASVAMIMALIKNCSDRLP